MPNCSVTRYETASPDVGGMVLRLASFVAPLEDSGTQVTREPDAPVAPKA